MPPSSTPAADNVRYEPLPLTQEQPQDVPYNPYNPPLSSNNPFMAGTPPPFLDPPSHSPNQGYDSDDVGVPRPRFLGAAAASESPSMRDSIASSTWQSAHTAVEEGAGDGTAKLGASRGSSYGNYRDDPNSSAFFGSEAGLPLGDYRSSRYLDSPPEKITPIPPRKKSNKRKIIILAGILVAAIIAVAVAIPIALHANKKTSSATSSGTGAGTGSASPTSTSSASGGSKPKVAAVVSGGDGSTVTRDDGSTFTYQNSFGGSWYSDPNDPFNNNAQVNSWTPPLNQTFDFSTTKIMGVNLGGWLNTEPFIVPALYEPYTNLPVPAWDEWTLSWAMGNDTANGGLNQLETHYKTFITEDDFAEIASAGLNFVRIPIPYWAIETRSGEPFLAKTAWTYFVKAIGWARKYGIRINIDLHALPGSQNGWNHSGRLGDVNVLNGAMGYANAQRSLDYIRIIAEFISQPQYRDVVVMFGITNEPQATVIGQDVLSAYYLQAYEIVRTASGVGKNGPVVSYHDGFLGLSKWAGFLPNADRAALDYHPYLCFDKQITTPLSANINAPCNAWGAQINSSLSQFGMTAAGEFSNALNDCGKWVNGVPDGTRYDGTYQSGAFPKIGDCTTWTDWQSWDASFKSDVQQFAMSSMDALQNWFFWNWKIGNSSVTGKVESPAWSYQLGFQNGWMPKDPRAAYGSCGNISPFTGTITSGSGNVATAAYPWPPSAISNAGAVTLMPSYTPTGAIPTLAGPTLTASATATANVGNGWANPADSASMMVAIATCPYLDPWIGQNAPLPPVCGGGTKRGLGLERRAYPARMTAMPEA